jgi:hypothetical protein
LSKAIDALFREADRLADIDAAVAKVVADILAEPSKRRRKATT